MFDFMLGEAGGVVPFPFSSLMKMIERHSPHPKTVLIPLGRSLQRTASAPDFFAFPRVVVATDSEPVDSHLMLKDRLFLGYNEKAGIIEVISYNDAAGRFEFQVVKDYREGGAPKVFHANRAVCFSCHQNAGPIFSRPLWDETNANAQLASRLQETRRDFFGVSPSHGVDRPNELDDATDRANLFALYQLLWQEGCENDACRGDLLLDLLQYRLSAKLNPDRWEQEWSARWPQGLALPNADIPNRDPLLNASTRLLDVPANLEALSAREPLQVWFAREGAARALAGFSELIATSDVTQLDQWLVRQPDRVSRYESRCEFLPGEDRVLDFKCEGDFIAEGRLYFEKKWVKKGRVDRLALNGEALRDLQVASGSIDGLRLRRGSLNARLSDGNAIEHVQFAWRQEPASPTFSGMAALAVRDDFASVRAAVAQLVEQKNEALSAKPFSRATVMRALFANLGVPVSNWCCEDESKLPPAALDTVKGEVSAGSEATQGFLRWCANCHRSNDRFPPNFLTGDARQVRAKLEHCAERIYVRLSMHNVAEKDRAKTPMPPATAREGLEAAELRGLRAYVADIIKSQRGRLPEPEEVLLHGYENLRECLPS